MHYLGRPVPDDKQLTAEDCPSCGRPTLTGIWYGGDMRTRVRLDAMPIPIWRQSVLFGEYVEHYPGDEAYVEHACPLDLEAGP